MCIVSFLFHNSTDCQVYRILSVLYIYTHVPVCVCVGGGDGWIACFRLLVTSTGKLYTIYWIFRRQHLNCHCGAFFAGPAAAALWKSGSRPVVSRVHLGRIETCVTADMSYNPENNRNRLMSDDGMRNQKGPTAGLCDASYFDRVWWGNLIRASPSSIAGS